MDVQFGNVKATCLLDPGSQVTTVGEAFYRSHLEPEGYTLQEVPRPFALVYAGGTDIPYAGCFEADVHALGEVI